MEILPPDLAGYLEHKTTPEGEVLADLYRETHLKVLMPQMVSGKMAGNVLQLLSRMVQPKYILEIGTFTGYATICLAAGLQPGGKLYSIDINEELRDMVEGYLQRANVAGQVELMLGDATKLIPEMDFHFDLVFIDADKRNYSLYYDLVIDKVNKNGLILADNVLWSGKVYQPQHTDKDTEAIRAFNDKVDQDPRVTNFILPIRDGLMVALKN